MSIAQSWVTGTGKGMVGETKDLREKVKQLTKREIELQDKLEQMEEELKFRNERERAVNYLSKKKLGSNIEQEELKRKYQKEIQVRYESKITDLCLKIKDLEYRNKSLAQNFKMFEDQAEKMDIGEVKSTNFFIYYGKKCIP